MRRLITLLALLALPAKAAAESPFSDLSEEHPAYDIVLYLVDEGYLDLYNGDEFRASQPMTRLEVALLVDRMLKRVADGSSAPSEMDAQAMRLLAEEFRAEIIRVDDRLFAFEARLKRLEDEQPQIVADVVSLRRDVESRLADFGRELASLRAEWDRQGGADAAARSRLDALEARLDDLESRMQDSDDGGNDGFEGGTILLLIAVVGAAIALA